jgi:galactoside O-acetyltransferase
MTEDDLDNMAALLGDPEVMRHYPAPKTRDEARAWIEWNQRLYRDEGFGLWVVSLRDTGEFVGDCGLTVQEVDGVRELEVGYHVRTRMQGSGLATEAAGACRDFARDVVGAKRLIAIIRPDNAASQRVAEKIGLPFEREATLNGLPVRIHAGRDRHEVLERIRRGLIYTESEAAFLGARRRADLVFEYNRTPPSDLDARRSLLETIFASVGERAIVVAPFHAAYGSNVHIGDDFFGNTNLTFVDDVDIRIGHGVMIAPSVTLTTTGHPVHPARRVDFARFSEPIVIEDKVWIGSNAVVLPGVRIGYGSVIGAGSVVSKDIPPMVVAVGAPCRPVRAITDEDLATRGAAG